MSEKRVNYDVIAPGYDERYPEMVEDEPRAKALLDLARSLNASRILEVGCGTAHWLAALTPVTSQLFGLDTSAGMLHQARAHKVALRLTRGAATGLPFANDSFDLVYCVDAIHHFGDVPLFVAEAFRVLRPGGMLAIIGNDPHSGEVVWYGYQYFEGVYATDLQRFPPHKDLVRWMENTGFAAVKPTQVEYLGESKVGREIWNDPFLKKNANSQFALLSDEVYNAGLEKIKSELAEAETHGETLVFDSRWPVIMLSGQKPGN